MCLKVLPDGDSKCLCTQCIGLRHALAVCLPFCSTLHYTYDLPRTAQGSKPFFFCWLDFVSHRSVTQALIRSVWVQSASACFVVMVRAHARTRRSCLHKNDSILRCVYSQDVPHAVDSIGRTHVAAARCPQVYDRATVPESGDFFSSALEPPKRSVGVPDVRIYTCMTRGTVVCRPLFPLRFSLLLCA